MLVLGAVIVIGAIVVFYATSAVVESRWEKGPHFLVDVCAVFHQLSVIALLGGLILMFMVIFSWRLH